MEEKNRNKEIKKEIENNIENIPKREISSNNPNKKNILFNTVKSMKKELFTLSLIGQALILLIIAVTMALVETKSVPDELSLKDWTSDYIYFKNGVWYADESVLQTKDTVDLICGPYVPLDKGSYLVTVDYECSDFQSCYAVESDFIESGTGRLIKGAEQAVFHVNVKHNILDFKIIFRYSGKGSLKIKNVTIREHNAGLGRTFVYLMLIFALFDIYYLFSSKIKENKTLILCLLGIVFLCSIPLFTGGIGKGHDLYFHANRIEALAESLKCGVFPNRVSGFWMDGYGYPASIYYGDILLYVAAVLRLMGFTVVTAYKGYILFINISTVFLCYFCFNGMFRERRTALLATLVYSTATYRLVNIYIRSAVGEYTAMLFLPLIAYGFYLIYTGDMTKRNEYLKSATLLALGMSGVIDCHVLSTEMVCFIIIIACIVLFKRTIKPRTIRALGIAAAETLLLSLYFIVPFLDYYTNVTVWINEIMEEDDLIQWQGCSLAEYFAVFRDVFSTKSVHANKRLACTPGFILMAALLIGIFVLFYRKRFKNTKELAFYTAMSIFSLYTASDIFPWDTLSVDTSFGHMLSQVQFPWRYVTMAILFLTFMFAWLYRCLSEKDFGSIGKYIRSGAALAIVIACFFSSAFFDGAYLDDSTFRHWRDGGDIDPWAVGSGEYLLSDYSDNVPCKCVAKNLKQAYVVERKSNKTVIYCEGSNKNGTVEFPVFNYKGYVVTDHDGNVFEITDGTNNTVKVNIPSNFKGKLTAEFKEPVIWRISEIISLTAFISLFVIALRLNKKRLYSLLKT